MRYLILILAIAGCTPKLIDSNYSKYEDGYYINTMDHKGSFFCKGYYYGDYGIMGFQCKDVGCTFAGNKLVTIEKVILKEAVVMETKEFQFNLLPCGPTE